MPRRPEDVANELVEESRACRGESGIYKYTGAGDVGWVSVDSANANFCVSLMMGSMASVNTDIVSLPVRRILTSRSLPKIHIPMSVCYNGKRFAISVAKDIDGVYDTTQEEDTVVLLEDVVVYPHQNVVEKSVCLKSIPNPCVSRAITAKSLTQPVISRITSVMGNNTLALLWYLGNALIDPHRSSYLLAILGPSGTEKSTLMNLISQCFSGSCSVIPGDVITGKASLTPQQVINLTDCRLAQSNDIEHEDNTGISKQALKQLTGSDPIEGANGETVNVSVTVMYTTNSLPSPNAPDMWARLEVMKRFAVLHIEANFPANNMLMPPLTTEDEANLPEAMMYTRMTYQNPEGTFQSAICSVMLGHHTSFLGNVVVILHNEKSESEMMERECETFRSLVACTGSNDSDIAECLTRVSPGYLRLPNSRNGFRYGIVNRAVRDPSRLVIRSGTTYEQRTLWTMCRTVGKQSSGRGSGRIGSGSYVGPLVADHGTDGGGSSLSSRNLSGMIITDAPAF